jgi:ABC-2 type transport system ATP-binding protein
LAADGRTLFVSSHLMTEMSMVADHLIVIDRGRVLADTSMPEFLRRHGRTYVRVRTPEPGLLSRELERAGATPKLAPDGSPEVAEMPSVEINRVAAGHGLPLDELSTDTGSLEDGFLGLVDRSRGGTGE